MRKLFKSLAVRRRLEINGEWPKVAMIIRYSLGDTE